MNHIRNVTQGEDAVHKNNREVTQNIFAGIGIIILILLAIAMLWNQKHNDGNIAAEHWKESGIEEQTAIKMVNKGSEDTILVETPTGATVTYSCHQSWLDYSRVCRYEMSNGEQLRSLPRYMMKLYESDIDKIADKYDSITFSHEYVDIVTYNSPEVYELRDFLDEVMALPMMKDVYEFCGPRGVSPELEHKHAVCGGQNWQGYDISIELDPSLQENIFYNGQAVLTQHTQESPNGTHTYFQGTLLTTYELLQKTS